MLCGLALAVSHLLPLFSSSALNFIRGLQWPEESSNLTISQPRLPPRCREFSLGAASLADSLGVALADVAGILIQGCLFRANGLPGADFACGA